MPLYLDRASLLTYDVQMTQLLGSDGPTDTGWQLRSPIRVRARPSDWDNV